MHYLKWFCSVASHILIQLQEFHRDAALPMTSLVFPSLCLAFPGAQNSHFQVWNEQNLIGQKHPAHLPGQGKESTRDFSDPVLISGTTATGSHRSVFLSQLMPRYRWRLRWGLFNITGGRIRTLIRIRHNSNLLQWELKSATPWSHLVLCVSRPPPPLHFSFSLGGLISVNN